VDRFAEVTDSTLLVAPDVAMRQREQETAAASDGAASVVSEREPQQDGGPVAPVLGESTGVEESAPKSTRFFGTHRVDPERYSRDLTRVSQEILQHLAAEDGVELEVIIEIHARRPGGFSEERMRTVNENARVLKFEQFGFQDE
jgi:hypothetical protein